MSEVQIGQPCQCKGCERIRLLQGVLLRVDEEDGEFLCKLWEGLVHAEMDVAYYKSIVQGIWPDSDKVIENVRKERRERFNENTTSKQS